MVLLTCDVGTYEPKLKRAATVHLTARICELPQAEIARITVEDFPTRKIGRYALEPLEGQPPNAKRY